MEELVERVERIQRHLQNDPVAWDHFEFELNGLSNSLVVSGANFQAVSFTETRPIVRALGCEYPLFKSYISKLISLLHLAEEHSFHSSFKPNILEEEVEKSKYDEFKENYDEAESGDSTKTEKSWSVITEPEESEEEELSVRFCRPNFKRRWSTGASCYEDLQGNSVDDVRLGLYFRRW